MPFWWHVSPLVHGLPSLQSVPSPAWLYVHFRLLPHVPIWQPPAGAPQSLLTRQLPPQPKIGVKMQAALTGSQLSAVHAWLSLQTLAAVPLHLPFTQTSPVVHAVPSSQASPLFLWVQPLTSHASMVHALASSQFFALPATHFPPSQLSPVVQPLPSSHAPLLGVNTHPRALSHLSLVQELPSSHTTALPTHKPPPHLSPSVHALESLQLSVLLAKTQPLAGAQLSLVHGLLSWQEMVRPPAHLPPAQTSPLVQVLPSSHALPSAELPVLHLPLPGSHRLTWQTSLLAGQVTMVAASTTQAPDEQIKLPLHASPSSNLAQSLVKLQPHAPLPGLHTPPPQLSPLVQVLPSVHVPVLGRKVQPLATSQPSSVHGLPSLQVNLPLPLQERPLQVSPVVHALPSSHAKPLSPVGTCWQPLPLSQLSLVQAFPSSQVLGTPAHTPLTHASLPVQASPSSQLPLVASWLQLPVPMSQASLVQPLPSSQFTPVPLTHLPPLHKSMSVQGLESLQESLLALLTQPIVALQLSSVHALSSVQLIALPAHAPLVQMSPPVHWFLSSQLPPSGVGALLQPPIVASQLLISQALAL